MTDSKIVRLQALAGVCMDMRELITINTPPEEDGECAMLRLLDAASRSLEAHIVEELILESRTNSDRPAIEGQLDLGDIELPMATMDVTAPELELASPPRKKRGRPAKKKTR